MDKNLAHLINGQWRKGQSNEVITVVDPATEETLATIASASAADTEDAIAAAEVALKTWRATPAWTRAEILHKCADVMAARIEEGARQMTLESGKPLAQARREWQLSIDQFRWYAEEARRITGRIVQIKAHDAAEVETVLATLRAAHCPIEDLEIGRADLEDVFLNIMQGEHA